MDSFCCNRASPNTSVPKKEHSFSSLFQLGCLPRPSLCYTVFSWHFASLSTSLIPPSLSRPLCSQSPCLLRRLLCVPQPCLSPVADFDPRSFPQKPVLGFVCASERSYRPLCHLGCLHLVPGLPTTSVLCSDALQTCIQTCPPCVPQPSLVSLAQSRRLSLAVLSSVWCTSIRSPVP